MGNEVVSLAFPGCDTYGIILLVILGIAIAVPVTKRMLLPIYFWKKAEHEEGQKKWLDARGRWENSYYCQRHDIIFVKGEDTPIDPEKYQDYLRGVI